MTRIGKNYGFEYHNINKSATFVSLLVLLAFFCILSPAVYAVDYPNDASLYETNQTSVSAISSSFKTNLDRVYAQYHEYADKFSATNFAKGGQSYSNGTFIGYINTPLNLTSNFSVSQAYAPQMRSVCIFQSNVKDNTSLHNEVTYGRLPLQGFVSNFLGINYNLVTETDISNGALNNCSELLIPAIQQDHSDNATKWMEEIKNNLTLSGLNNLKNFVSNGGSIFAESDGMYVLQMANITGNNTVNLTDDNRLFGSSSKAYIQFNNFTNPASFGYNSSNVSAYTIGDPMINLTADGNLTSVANFSGKLVYANGSFNNYVGTAIAYKDFGNGRVYLSAPHLASSDETQRALAFIITYGLSERMEFERNISLIDLPNAYFDANNVLVIPALEPNINLSVSALFGNTWNETLANVKMRINIDPGFQLDSTTDFCTQLNNILTPDPSGCSVHALLFGQNDIEVNFSTLNPGLFNATYKIWTRTGGVHGLTNVGNVTIDYTDVNGQTRNVFQNRLYVNARTRADIRADKYSNLPSPLAANSTYYSYIDIVAQNKGETPAINVTISDIVPNNITITVRDEKNVLKNTTVNITVTCPTGWTTTDVLIYNYADKHTGEFYPVINATNCSTTMSVSAHDNIDPIGRINIIVDTPIWWNETYWQVNPNNCANNPPCNDSNCSWINISANGTNITGDSFPFNLGGILNNDATVGPSNTSKIDYKDVWDRNYTTNLREMEVNVIPTGIGVGMTTTGARVNVTKSIYMVLENGSVSDVLRADAKANVTIELAIVPNNCIVYNYTTHECNCSGGNKTAYCSYPQSSGNVTLIYLEDTIPKGVNYLLNITGVSLEPNTTNNTPFYTIYSWRNLVVPCGNVTKIYINATIEPLGTEGELTVNKGGVYQYYDVDLGREVVKLLPIDSVKSEISQFAITKGTHPSLLPPGGQGKHVYHSIEIYDNPEMHQFMDPYYHSYGFKNGTVRTYTGGTLPYQTTSYSSIVNTTNNFTIIQLIFSNTGNETWNISNLNISNITMRHLLNSPDFSSNFNITSNFNLPVIVNPGEYKAIYLNVTYNGSLSQNFIYEANFNFTANNVPENFSIAPAKIGIGNFHIYDFYDYGRDIIISDTLRSGVAYNSSKYILGACPENIDKTVYDSFSSHSFNYTSIIGDASTGTDLTWNLRELNPTWNNSVTLPYVINYSGTFISRSRFCILIDSLWLGGTTGTYPINLGASVNYTDNTWNEEKNATSIVPETDVHGPLINVTKKITDIYTFLPPDNYCQYIYPFDPSRPNFSEPLPVIPYNMTSMVCMMIYVRNDGDAVASNVTITDLLPPNSTYIPKSDNYYTCTPPSPRDSYRIAPSNVSNDTPNLNYTTLNYSLADIAPGGTAKILVCVNVTPNETNGIAPGANITINEPVNASFMSDLFPGDKFNESNYEELNASSNETVLQINKTASVGALNATVPTLINLTINVTNIGYVMAEHVYIIDDIPLYNSTYQMSAIIVCIKIYLVNSTGVFPSNNTCDDGSGMTGTVGYANYTYYGIYSGTSGTDDYKYTLKYRVLSNLSAGDSFIINVTLNLTVNLSAEHVRLNYNPATWADNAILKEGPPVEVNVTVYGPRLNISKEVSRICPPPINKTCVAACSNSGSGDGSSWNDATCLSNNQIENSVTELAVSGTTQRYYKYVLDGWSYINITMSGTLVSDNINLYTDWNGTKPNSTKYDCYQTASGAGLKSITCVSLRPLPPGTYYVYEEINVAVGLNITTTFKATCYSDECWNKGYMIADQANPNNTLDLQFNISNNLPWQEATLTAYNITIYDELQNFVKVWDFNRWNNTPNNTKIYYNCNNGSNGTLNIIENYNNLNNGILNFMVDSTGLPIDCTLYFNVSVTYAPPCASNAEPNYLSNTYCNPYWNDSSIYNQLNHNYILNLKPTVSAYHFNWKEGNSLDEEVRWKRPYFDVIKAANTSTAEPGDYVNFTINITNTGNSTVYELIVNDTLPTGFVYNNSSWTSNTTRDISNIVTLNSTSPSIIWKIWNITVGETITINLKTYVTSQAGNVTGKLNQNKVNVSNRNQSYEDHIFVKKNATANVTVYIPNIKVSKISDGPTEPGDYVIFKITANNLNYTTEHATLYNISIKDVLPKCFVYNNTLNITYSRKQGTTCNYTRFPGPPGGEVNASSVISNTTSGDGNYMNVTWNLTKISNLSQCDPTNFNDSQLHPNETIEIYFNVYVKTCSDKSPTGANVTNIAIVNGYDGNNTEYNFTGSVNITVYEPNLVLTKTTNATKAEPGETVRFCLNITNPSNAEALNLVIRDVLPKHWNYSDNTTIHYYRPNFTLLGITLGAANYSHVWNESNTNTTGNSGNGQNVTWNLSYYENQTTTACYLAGVYQGNSSAGDCSDILSCGVVDGGISCTPYQFNDTQLAPNESLMLCFDARVETHENKTQVVSNTGMVYYADGDNGEHNGQGDRYVAVGNTSLVVNQPYLVLDKLANQSITEPGGNNSNATLFTLNVTNPSNATAFNISVIDLLPVGWKYNNTLNITYRRNITVCRISIVIGDTGNTEAVCNSTFITYNRTWNETDINISQRADNGYNVTWNLSKLGDSEHTVSLLVGGYLISSNVTCNDADLGPNSCNGSIPLYSARAGTDEYLEIRFIATTWANASAGINGTGAPNQNNVTAFGVDGNGTPIDENWIVNGTINVTNVEPYLVLNKTADKSVVGIGEYIDFYLNTTNIGNGTAISVNVSDALPQGFIYDSTNYIKIADNELNTSLFNKCNSTLFCSQVNDPQNYPGCSLTCCNNSNSPNNENTYYYNNSCNITIQTTTDKQNVTWYLNAVLHPQESILINFSTYVSSNTSPGINTNFAYSNGTFLSGEPISTENKGNVTLNLTVCKPNLTISKQITDVNAGAKKINLTVKNIGCGSAYFVEISDELPVGWIYDYTSRVVKTNATSSTFDIPYSIILGNPVIWKPYDSIDPSNSNPDLYANESITVIVYVKITDDARQGNNTDYANVSYKDADNGTYSANTSNASPVQTPMEISKSANISNVKNGDYVNFVIHVKNPIQRSDPLTGAEINFPQGCVYNLTITDLLPETWMFNNTNTIDATLTYNSSQTLTFNPISPPNYVENYNSATNEIKWLLHKNATEPYNNSFCPGSELLINFTARAGDFVPVNGIATNYVNVTGNDSSGNPWTMSWNTTPLNVTEEAFLNITKEILDEQNQYSIGETVKFLINVSNPMANVLYNVTVDDELPCGLIISSYTVEHNTSQYICNITNSTCGNCKRSILSCKFDNLSSYNYTLIYVNATILNCTTAGPHSNYVIANGFRPGKIFEKHDLAEFNVAPLQGNIIFDAQKTIGNYVSGKFEPGDRIIFALKASNFGDSPISNVTLTDELPIGAIYDHYASSPLNIVENVSITNNTEGGQIVVFTINKSKTLGPGEEFIVYIYVNVTSNMSEGTNVNKLIAEGKQPNGQSIRDEDNRPFTVGKPKLEMTKKALNKTVKPGENVTYNINIENTGTGTAYNLNFTDIFPPNWNIVNEEINITPDPMSKIRYFDFDTGNSSHFGQSNSPTASGYISVTNETYTIDKGYGWKTNHHLLVDNYNDSFNYSKNGDLNPNRDRDYQYENGGNVFIIDLPTKIHTFTVRTVFCNPVNKYQQIYVNITTNNNNYVVLSNRNIVPGDCFINTTKVNANGQLNITFFSSDTDWMINAIMVDAGSLSGLQPGQTANITYTLHVPENESCGHLFANDLNVHFDDGMGFSQDLEARDDVLTVCDTNLEVNKFINSSATTFAPGDVVPFVINVSNKGINNLYNITVYDDIPTGTMIKNITYYNGTGWTWAETFPITIPELKGNNYTLITLLLNVTGESFGEKKNHVYVRAQKAGGEYVGAEDDALFTLGKPDLSITKENLVPYAHPGEIITYQVEVKNNGDAVASGVNFLDFLPDDFEVLNLTSDCIQPIKFDFGPEEQKVKQGWINITPSTTYSTVTGYGFAIPPTPVGHNTSPSINDEMMNDSISENPMAFLADVQNGLYNVTFYYDNGSYGGKSLKFLKLNDISVGVHLTTTNWTYPNFLNVTNGRINFTTTDSNEKIRGLEIKLLFSPTKVLNYSIGNMEAGKTCTFIYNVKIPEGTPDGVYYNNASVTWNNGLNNSFNATAKDDVDVHNLANLDINKTIVNVNHKFETGDVITFRIDVRNTGINTMHNLTFEDRLPLGVEFLHLSPGINTNVTIIDDSIRGQVLQFSLHNATNASNDISGNSTQTFYMYVKVHSNATGGKNFNYINAQGYDINGKEEKDSSLVEFDIGKSHVIISKKALNKTAKPGDIIYYEVELENIGDATAYGSKIYNLTLTEELPTNWTIVNSKLEYIPTFATLACYDFSASTSEITGSSWSPIEPGCYPVYKQNYSASLGYGYWWAEDWTSIFEKDYLYEDDSLRDYHYSTHDATLRFDLPILLNKTINVTLYFFSVDADHDFMGVNASDDNITWESVMGEVNVLANNLTTKTFEFNTTTKQLYLKFIQNGSGNDWIINKIVIQYIGFANASTNETITIPVLAPTQKAKFTFGIKVPDYECNGMFPNYANMDYGDKEGELGSGYAKDDVLIQSQAFLNVTKEILNKKQNYSIGDTIQFKINVSNAYANDIYNISLIDDLACGLNITDTSYTVVGNTTPYSCNIFGNVCNDNCGMKFNCNLGTLNGNGNIVVYLNATVKECMLSGQHDNYIKAEGRRCNETYEKHDHVEFSIAEYGELYVVKTSNTSDILQPGENVTYTVKVGNTGGRNLIVNITDAPPYGFICANDSLLTNVNVPANSEITRTFNCHITSNASAGSNVNEVYVNGTSADGKAFKQQASSTVTVGKPEIKIIKEAITDKVVPGSNVTYKITIINEGKAKADNITITDILPDGWTFEAITTSGCSVSNESQSGNIIRFVNGSISASSNDYQAATCYFEFNVSVPSNESNGIHYNKFNASYMDGDNTTYEIPTQKDNGIDVQNLMLYVEKFVNISNAQPGDTVKFTIKVKNIGNEEVNVTLIDEMPDGFAYVNNTAKFVDGANIGNSNISAIANYLNISIGNIVQGEEKFVEFNVLINDSAQEGANRNKIIAKGISENKEVNSTSYAYLTIYKPEINVIKSASQYFVAPGDEVEFTVTILNPSYADLYNLTVNDTLPMGFEYVVDSSTLNGKSIANPTRNPQNATENNRQELIWNYSAINDLSSIKAKALKILKYRARVVHCNITTSMLNEVSVNGVYSNGNLNVSKTANTSVKIVGMLANATIVKYVNKDVVSWFDVLEYTIVIKANETSGSNIHTLTLSDYLPKYLKYINNSANVDGSLQNPEVNGNITTGQNLTWNLSDNLLSPGQKLTITYKCLVYPGIDKDFNNTVYLNYSDPSTKASYSDISYNVLYPTLPGNEIYGQNESTYQTGKVSGTNKGIATSDACINAKTIRLSKGWNLISLPVKPLNNTLESVLSPIEGKWTDVFTYGNGGWIYKSEYMNKWFGNLDKMDVGTGYWIKVSEDVNLTVIGDEIVDWKINLTSGWNLVGVIGCSDENMNNITFSNSDKNVAFTDIFGYENRWVYRSEYMNKWFGDLNSLNPGKGYWIKVEDNCIMELKS